MVNDSADLSSNTSGETVVRLDLDTAELAAAYDVVGRRQLSHGKLLITDLDIQPDAQVLDLGAGTGLLATYVGKFVAYRGRVVAVDPLPFRVELAKRKIADRLEVLLGKAEDLGFLPSESFDVVYLNSVIHWIPDIGRALAEIRQVLKPGGRLGISTPSKETPHDVERARERALRQCGLLSGKDRPTGPPSKVSEDDLRALLGRSGYQLRQMVCRTVVDYESSADAVFRASEVSAFGNHLSGLSAEQRRRVRRAFSAALEAYRTPRGLRLERHLIFAVAEKPI